MFFFLLDSPPIPAHDQLLAAVQYPPTPSDPVSNTRPRSAGFVAIPAPTQPRGDSVNDMSAKNASGKPNVWFSGLLSASLPSTSDVSPRSMAPVAGGELGICPRTSSEAREAREHVQRLIDSWIGDAKTVLKFVNPIQRILCLISY